MPPVRAACTYKPLFSPFTFGITIPCCPIEHINRSAIAVILLAGVLLCEKHIRTPVCSLGS